MDRPTGEDKTRRGGRIILDMVLRDADIVNDQKSLAKDIKIRRETDTWHKRPVQKCDGGRFYKLSRAVHMVVRVCRAMKVYAQLGIVDYDSFILGKCLEDEGLVFDAGRYRRRQQFRLPTIYHEAAQKLPSMKTSSEICLLHKMMRSLQAFRRFDHSTQREICRCLRYERYSKNRVIIRQSHQPQAVYFIFSGTVSERFTDSKAEEIRYYKRGDMFGVADIVFNQCRSSTITCEDMVEVLVLYLKDFARSSIMAALKKATNERLDLIRRRGPLSVLSEEALQRLVSVSSTFSVNDDKFVVMENHWVYLLYKGFCNMTRMCSSNELTPDLKVNLRKTKSAGDRGNGLKTTDQWDESELSDRQKLLRFLDSVDNNVSSRVNTSWPRKSKITRKDPTERCSTRGQGTEQYYYTTESRMENPDREFTNSLNEVTDCQSRSTRTMRTPCSQSRNDDNSQHTTSPSIGEESALQEDAGTCSVSCQTEQDLDNSDTSSSLFSQYDYNEESTRVIPANESRCNSGSRHMSESCSCLHFTVRHLKTGDLFGKVFLKKSEDRIGFLSKSSTLLTIPLSVYLRETPLYISSSIQLTLSQIPDSELLCSLYNKSLVWEGFKTSFVESLRTSRIESSSRQSDHGYYLRKVFIPRANGPASACHKVNNNTLSGSHSREIENKKRYTRSRFKSNCFRPHSVPAKGTGSNKWTGDRYWIKSAPPWVPSTLSSPVSTMYGRNNLSACKMKSSLTGVRPLVQQLPSSI